MDKEAAVKALRSEGYIASVENSIVMVVLPEGLTGQNIDSLYKEVGEKLKAMDYDASFGISRGRKMGKAINAAETQDSDFIDETEDEARPENKAAESVSVPEKTASEEDTKTNNEDTEDGGFGTLGAFSL